MMRSSFILVLAALIAASVGGFPRPLAAAAGRIVEVYGWSDYIAPDVLDEFTKKTGIEVVYDTYDSNEALETKLLAGHTGYDVVIPSGTFLERQIKAGLYLKLDKSKLPHMSGLWPQVMARLAAHDSGNRYAVDYMWFTTGLAYNVDKARERLGNTPIDSWDILFKPELLRKFADCGVYVLDSPEEMFPIALNYLHLKPNSKRLGDLYRAAMLLSNMRRYVKKFQSSEYINALANGDICLAVARSGDAFMARDRAREADNGVNIAYVIPKEGTSMSLDALAIPADAPHPDAAYQFIDYLMRPRVAAANTNATGFANGVLASKPFVTPDLLNDAAIYPDAETMKRLFAVTTDDQQAQKYVTREWTAVKGGK